jgi:hypothetical protein
MYYMYMGTMQIPIPPETMRTKIRNRNKEISLIDGDINIIKDPGLTEIQFKILLPNQAYPFNQSMLNQFDRAASYIDQLEQLKQSQDPFRFIMVRMTDGGQLLNMDNIQCTLEDYSLDEDAREGYDFYANIELKQYREWGAKKITIDKDGNGNTVAKTESARSTIGHAGCPGIVAAKEGDTLQTICLKNFGMKLAYSNLPIVKKLNKIAVPAVLAAHQQVQMYDAKFKKGGIPGGVLY